jgi:uncharacterized membrane protein
MPCLSPSQISLLNKSDVIVCTYIDTTLTVISVMLMLSEKKPEFTTIMNTDQKLITLGFLLSIALLILYRLNSGSK